MCAWTAARTWVVGEILTGALLNVHLRDNVSYLKGQAGAVTIEDEVRFSNDAEFRLILSGGNPLGGVDTNDYWVYNRGSNAWQWVVGSVEKARIDTNGVHSYDGATLMRVHRHPYANDRHIESGTITIATATKNTQTSNSTNFTNAFAVAPNAVAVYSNHDAGPGWYNYHVRVTTTTAAITAEVWNTDGATDGTNVRVFWLAEGQD